MYSILYPNQKLVLWKDSEMYSPLAIPIKAGGFKLPLSGTKRRNIFVFSCWDKHHYTSNHDPQYYRHESWATLSGWKKIFTETIDVQRGKEIGKTSYE